MPKGSDQPSGPSSISSVRKSRVPSVDHDRCRCVFLEVVSFPFRQGLALNGASEDTTLPAPLVIDEPESWGVVAEDDVDEDDLYKFEGMWNENAPTF